MRKKEEWEAIQKLYFDSRKAVMSGNFKDLTEIQLLLFITQMDIFEPHQQQVEILETAHEYFPESGLIKLRLARRYVTENRLEKAGKLLLELEFTMNEDASLLIARGAYLIKTGKLEEGISDLEKAIDLAEAEATSINALSEIDFGGIGGEEHRAKYAYDAGKALLEGGHPGEAVRYFKQALRTPSDKPIFASIDLAGCYLKLGDEQKAIETMEKQLEETPFFIMAWMALGDLYLKQEEYDKAIDAYEYALAIDENYYPAVYGRAKAYLQKEEYAKAAENLTGIVDKVVEKKELLVHLCQAYAGAGDYDNLYKYGKKLTEAAPGFYLGWEALAVSCVNKLEWDEALPYIEKVLEIMPDNEDFLYYYGLANSFTGQDEKTVEAFGQLLRTAPDYPDISTIYIPLGNAYQGLNDDANSLKYYLKAYETGHREEKFTFTLALLYYRLNDIESVKKYLDLAIEDYSVDAPIFFIEQYPESRFVLAEYMRNSYDPGFDPDSWTEE